ncbi:MAG TPA: ABC transporter permease [Ktedonobacteraceae bacterium]|nr:ABC transporter permease [Ktedonobacteraceae bacterium]
MIIETMERSREQTVSPAMKQQRISLWGYYFYCEILKVFRDPAVLVFSIGFPSLFFIIFSGAFNAQYASTFLAQYAAYGAFVVAFQTFTIEISMERNLGWSRLLRTTPLSPILYLGSKVLVIVFTAIVSILLLYVVAFLFGHVHMPLANWLSLLGLMVGCMLTFALIGMALGFVGTSNIIQILSTVITLVLSLTSGLFMPLQYLPPIVRAIAPYLPTYHLGQVAWDAVGSPWSRDSYPLWFHLLVLGGFALVFAIFAVWAYLRDENKNFA